jgi:hypothetical protein
LRSSSTIPTNCAARSRLDGVGLGIATAELLDGQASFLQAACVDIGDLDLAARSVLSR